MQRKTKEAMAALVKKGFVPSSNKHKKFQYVTLAGKKTDVRTVVSHSSSMLYGSLLSTMARECSLSTGQFLNLLDCPLSREEYEKIIVKSLKHAR